MTDEAGTLLEQLLTEFENKHPESVKWIMDTVHPSKAYVLYDSGTMKLTLFGDQVDDIKGVKADAWLTLENAYCKDYKGKLELSVAYGKMEVVYNG